MKRIVHVTDTNVEAVLLKHADRAAAGLRKYGVDTDRTDLTEVEWLQHLQDELMDGAIYVERLMDSSKGVMV